MTSLTPATMDDRGARRTFFYALIWIFSVSYVLIGAPVVVLADEATSPSLPAAPSPAPRADEAARLFMNRCAGCHTVGGGAIGNSPDLLPSTAWQRPDLRMAVKRMEQNVGPMTDNEVDQLTDLLKAPDLRPRLEQERQVVVQLRQARLQPGSAGVGEALFFGRRPFEQGGMACAACHAAGGSGGGSLAVDLATAWDALGETGLVSAIQNANFPLMRPAYANQPVSEQEALHLTTYLRHVSENRGEQPASGRALPLGIGGVLLGMLALGAIGLRLRREDRTGTRAGLLRRATDRHGSEHR